MKIVVVGGGTAGCLSALLFKKYFPSMDVTLVRSSAIGILGPGEGLTPGINRVLKELKIDVDEFVAETGATVKNGIKFINWNKDETSWMHLFHGVTEDRQELFNNKDEIYDLYATAVKSNRNIDDINYFTHLSKNDMVNFEDRINYAYHIDSRRFVAFLEKTAEKRGIRVIDDLMEDVVQDNSGYISQIILKENGSLDCDFVIDCTGFRRLIIGKHYDTKWISMKEYLPATSAIACTLPQDNKYGPYTEARAMNYGWSWKIPLQHRYGCGYVYDNKYINAELAEKELKELFGNELEVVGKFEFDPGFFEKVWVNNCLAVGLSYSFFEPLEATAIATVITLMLNFLNTAFTKYVGDKNTIERERLNNHFTGLSRGIAAFLHWHYITNKTNTDFWKDFRKNAKSPDWPGHDFDKFLSDVQNNLLDKNNYQMPGWFESSWMASYAAKGFYINQNEVDKQAIEEYNKNIVKAKDESIKRGLSHQEFLQKNKTTKEKI
jgi:tryptophan halogenase